MSRRWGLSGALAGTACVSLLLFYATSAELLGDGPLPFGSSLTWPNPALMVFYGLWSFLGTVAAGSLCGALIALGAPGRFAQRAWLPLRDRELVFLATGLALLLPVGLRWIVLQQAPVTDDESAYHFAAELLASGRLAAESPPMKLFFDRPFMINDGQWYSQYFLGWPALMAPFTWLGLSGFANAFYCAATVPGLFLLTRGLGGKRCARACLALYLASPMILLGAATAMSHTSCLMALTYFGLFCLRAVRQPQRAHWSVACAFFFCLAFFIRPLTAVGLGAVPLMLWARALLRTKAFPSIFGFAVVAGLGAGLFLYVNWAQNGDPLLVAYHRMHQYTVENDYRFTHKVPLPEGTQYAANMQLGNLSLGATTIASALFRINFALLSWPSGLVFVPLALLTKPARYLFLAAVVFCAANLFTSDAGVDTFGPVHFFELALPLLLLSALGMCSSSVVLRALAQKARARELPRRGRIALPRRLSQAPWLLAVVLCGVGWVTFGLPRLNAAHQVALNVNMVYRLPEVADLDRAVLFSPRKLVDYCFSRPARGWVFWRPDLSPNLRQAPVIWVNHLSQEEDERLMREVFPERTGYVVHWGKDCTTHLTALSEIPPGSLPPGQPKRRKRGRAER